MHSISSVINKETNKQRNKAANSSMSQLVATWYSCLFIKGAFKYYVIKEVGWWGQKMAIFDDLQYY